MNGCELPASVCPVPLARSLTHSVVVLRVVFGFAFIHANGKKETIPNRLIWYDSLFCIRNRAKRENRSAAATTKNWSEQKKYAKYFCVWAARKKKSKIAVEEWFVKALVSYMTSNSWTHTEFRDISCHSFCVCFSYFFLRFAFAKYFWQILSLLLLSLFLSFIKGNSTFLT